MQFINLRLWGTQTDKVDFRETTKTTLEATVRSHITKATTIIRLQTNSNPNTPA